MNRGKKFFNLKLPFFANLKKDAMFAQKKR